jgi:hypothetical protein
MLYRLPLLCLVSFFVSDHAVPLPQAQQQVALGKVLATWNYFGSQPTGYVPLRVRFATAYENVTQNSGIPIGYTQIVCSASIFADSDDPEIFRFRVYSGSKVITVGDHQWNVVWSGSTSSPTFTDSTAEVSVTFNVYQVW